jgi:integrase
MDLAGDRVSGHLQVKGGKGSRRWFAMFRSGPKRHQVLLGPAHVKDSGRRTPRGAIVWRAADGPRPTPEHLTPPDAQAALDELLARARLAPPPEAPKQAEVVTLRQARDEWLRHVTYDRQRKPSTISDYRSQSERYLLGEFGADTPLAEITTEAIEEWQQRLIESEVLAHRTIQKAQVILHAILKRAKKKRWVERNAAEDADRIVVKSSGDFNVLAPEEVEAVIRAAEDELDAALWRTAVGTGLRMGELRALRWRDVDFSRRLVHVRWNMARWELGRPKSSYVRSVPMADQVAAALDGLSRRERWVGPDDFVFATELGRVNDDGKIRRRFYAALERAGLGHLRTKEEPFVFHDLRHTFGTLAVRSTQPPHAWRSPGSTSAPERARSHVPCGLSSRVRPTSRRRAVAGSAWRGVARALRSPAMRRSRPRRCGTPGRPGSGGACRPPRS